MGKASRKKKTSIQEIRSAQGGHPGTLETTHEVPEKGSARGTAQKKTLFLMLATISIVSFSVYFNTLYNGFVVDDMTQVLGNRWIRDVRYLPDIFSKDVWRFQAENIVSNYYRPLMHVIYMLNYHVFGLKPWGFHLVNVLFHVGNAVLVFLLLSRLIEKSCPSLPLTNPTFKFISLPFFASLLFATHSINTEAVAWIAAITDLSYTFFYLLSLYFYTRSDKDIQSLSYILSVASFSIALLCKEPAATLPAALLAYDIAFGETKKRPLSYAIRYIPYLLILGIYIIVRSYALGSFAPVKMRGDLNAFQYIINAFPLFAIYLWKLLLPINLNFFHTIDPIKSLAEVKGILCIGLTAAYVFITIVAYRKNRIAFFGLVLIALPLLPTLYMPARGGSAFSERYLYLPSVGFATLLALSLGWLGGRLRRHGIAVIIIFLLLAGFYSIQTVMRNRIWKDNVILYTDTIKKSPDVEMPRGNFGNALLDEGRIDEAIEQFRFILAKINPDSEPAYYNLGRALKKKGVLGEAEEAFQKAISLDPNDLDAHYNLAVIYTKNGRIDEAVEEYRIFMKLKPGSPETFTAIGRILEKDGFSEEAIGQYKRALNIDKNYVAAHFNVGNSFMKSGHLDKALEHFSAAVRLQPNDPVLRNMLGVVYGQKELYGKAVEQFEAAVKLAPSDPAYLRNLDRASGLMKFTGKAQPSPGAQDGK